VEAVGKLCGSYHVLPAIQHRIAMKRRTRPKQTGALQLHRLTFDPHPWFAAISKALETENHPILRLAIQDAHEGIRIYSEKFPLGIPFSLVPDKDLRELLLFLIALTWAGVAPPGWPRFERGNHALVAVGYRGPSTGGTTLP
jgi:hypothetical protein